MSKISKSPRRVALAAYRIAKNTLPDYNHRFSPKKFTQPQIFVCLVLKIFFKTDYRGIVAILGDSDDLRKAFWSWHYASLYYIAEGIKAFVVITIGKQTFG